MSLIETVTLRVAGYDFTDWTRIELTDEAESTTSGFTLEVADRGAPGFVGGEPVGPTALQTELRRRIADGAVITVLVGGAPFVEGVVDRRAFAYSRGNHSVTFTGRQWMADAIDAQHIGPYDFVGLKVEEIVGRMLGPLGRAVAALEDTGPPISQFRVNPERTINDEIQRLLGLRGLLASDGPGGGLQLARLGPDRAGATLGPGFPGILDASADHDHSQRRSEVSVGTESVAPPGADGGGEPEILAALKGGAVRHRPELIRAPGRADRATAEGHSDARRRRETARGVQARYTLLGWRRPGGPVWRPRVTVMVDDPWLDLRGEMTVRGVRLAQDASGTIARLDLVAAEAFATQPTGARPAPAAPNPLARLPLGESP